MTARQYRDAIKKLGLNLTTAAELFGIGYRTSRRYGKEGCVDRGIAMVLRMAIRFKLTPATLKEEFGDG